MTTYTIAERREEGYEIEIVDADGFAREACVIFASQEEAESWIVQDARLSGERATSLRLLWRR
jgi:hypothetical protein